MYGNSCYRVWTIYLSCAKPDNPTICIKFSDYFMSLFPYLCAFMYEVLSRCAILLRACECSSFPPANLMQLPTLHCALYCL
jgi:hypothetical protein